MSQPAEPSISKLLAETGQGSRSALRELYRLTSPELYGRILTILRDPQASRDVLEDTYLRVWQAAHLFDPEEHDARTMLNTMARTRAVNRLREDKSLRTVARGAQHRALAETLRNEEGAERKPAEREFVKEVSSCIDAMGQEYREIMCLAYTRALEYAEISSVTGFTEAQVKSKIREALEVLRDTLRR
ncbi:RNA polymerase sigma factor [Leisingera sp. XS_AS12]|uniref:RNA polymerase sigma factor n=1 Tax=Leisingera sp. XS_AS12 TaxID=3241294 RepID=UPI003511757C